MERKPSEIITEFLSFLRALRKDIHVPMNVSLPNFPKSR